MKKENEHIDEQALLAAYFRDENPKWLGILLERYTALLFGVAMKYLKDENKAKDIVQQVFIKALLEIPKKEIKNLSAWLYQVTKNECFNQFRSAKDFLDEENLVFLPQPEERSFSELLAEEEKSKELLNALKQLKKDQQVSLELFYFQQKSYQAISEELNMSLKQVKSHIQNGKRNLKIILMETNPDLFKNGITS